MSPLACSQNFGQLLQLTTYEIIKTNFYYCQCNTKAPEQSEIDKWSHQDDIYIRGKSLGKKKKKYTGKKKIFFA
jgi:hypothetical protein